MAGGTRNGIEQKTLNQMVGDIKQLPNIFENVDKVYGASELRTREHIATVCTTDLILSPSNHDAKSNSPCYELDALVHLLTAKMCAVCGKRNCDRNFFATINRFK